jgi:hypothetical protein
MKPHETPDWLIGIVLGIFVTAALMLVRTETRQAEALEKIATHLCGEERAEP